MSATESALPPSQCDGVPASPNLWDLSTYAHMDLATKFGKVTHMGSCVFIGVSDASNDRVGTPDSPINIDVK